MTTPPQPDPPPPAPQGGQDEAQRIKALEDHQGVVDGKLDQILGMLAPGRDPVTQGAPPPAPAADITEQMRQAVRDVAAEQASAQPQAPPAEIPPREVGIKGKPRLQARIFGKDPSS